MQWNLEQIRLFVSVAERQSFSAYIGANPWQTVAITTAVGLLAGFLLGRRS